MEGEDLLESFQKTLQAKLKNLKKLTPYEIIKQEHTPKDWNKAEQNHGLGYCKGNPNSLGEQFSLKTNQGESNINI
jgi:hypothetical protein